MPETRFFLRYDKYLVRAVDNMYTNLAKARPYFEQSAYPGMPLEYTPYLIEAATTGCESLNWLLEDPGEFEDEVKRIYAPSFMPSSFIPWTSQRARLEGFSDDFLSFLHLEKEIFIKAGMSPATAASLIDECRKINKLEGNPSQVIEGVKTLRDKACNAAAELQAQRQAEMAQQVQQLQAQEQQQKAEMERRERHHKIYGILGKVATGAGGILIIGLNFSILAATVGLSASGAMLSGELGVGLVVGAVLAT